MEKTAYTYSPSTYILVGIEYVQESPREEGVYLMPENCTLKEPLPFLEGYDVKYCVDEDKWVYEEIVEDVQATIDEEIKWRNNELRNTDIFMLPDYPLGFIKKRKIKKYRKKLRSWPNHSDFPDRLSRPIYPL